MRSLVAVVALGLVACGGGNHEVDEPPGNAAGGSGGGSSIEQPLALPTCTTTSTALLDCGDATCDGEVGHGLDWIHDLSFDQDGRLYALGERNLDPKGLIGEHRVSWFEGARWHLLPMLDDHAFYTMSTIPLTVAATAPTDVWLGAYGLIAHWDGTSWQRFDIGGSLFGLAAESSNSVWAADVSTLHHFDGTTWTSVGRYLGGMDFWRANSIRPLGDRVELGGSALSVWDGSAMSEEKRVQGFLVRTPQGANGWATADEGIAEQTDGGWVVHKTYGQSPAGGSDRLRPASLALWRDEVLVTNRDHLYQWLGGRMVQLNAPPLGTRLAPHVLSDGFNLWIADYVSATVWSLGDGCWEAYGPKNLPQQ